jgi:carbon catabolite-derepressing protein kinase
MQTFLAQSPPTHDNYMGSIPQAMSSTTRPQVIPPSSDNERARQGSTSSSQLATVRSPISTIGVLPSSTPEYHKAYMKGHPKPLQRQQEFEGPPSAGLSEEERATQARRLRPNFRAIPDQNRQRPEPMTTMPAKKPRPTKWQFGIRSRNQPAEAMLAIFKALRAMGADWEVPKIRKAGGRSESQSPGSNKSESPPRSRSRGSSVSSSSSHEEDAGSDDEASASRRELSVRNGDDAGRTSRGRSRKHHNAANDWGYKIPEDPWVINARFRKDGMFPPGVLHPSSTHSSRVDLHDAGLRRRSSTTTSLSSLNPVEGITSMTTSPENRDRPGSVAGDSTAGSTRYPSPDEAVYIYMSIQLYSIDRDFFVVDFKCAGYERLVSNLVREIKAGSTSSTSISQLGLGNAGYADGWDDEQGVWRRLGDGEHEDDVRRELRDGEGEGGSGLLRERTEEVGAGRKEGDKRCTSPFPFLDVASTLILQLSGE